MRSTPTQAATLPATLANRMGERPEPIAGLSLTDQAPTAAIPYPISPDIPPYTPEYPRLPHWEILGRGGFEARIPPSVLPTS